VNETSSGIAALSDELAGLVVRGSESVVAVEGGGGWPSSGILWRPGVIVTAEEVLGGEEGFRISGAGFDAVPATLVGRDPSTDIAVLRAEPHGTPVAGTAGTAELRPGALVLAVGRHRQGPVASLGIVAVAGGAWHSMRGGTIDSLIRLDMRLARQAEGAAVFDARGRVVGMAVTGPRRRVLAIPAATIERTVEQILARGRVVRGYLGASLQPARVDQTRRGVLVAGLDPEGPAARAGLLVGDAIVTWNERPIMRVREVMHLLGPESVGSTVALGLVRGGAAAHQDVVIGERPAG
jgi:S1-C subfamily serine protease